MKVIAIILLLLSATSALAQAPGDPSTDRGGAYPSGSGTSTSGGVDRNDDQGRDKMGTTGRASPSSPPDSQTSSDSLTTSEPAQPNVTGQQKSGTNAEGRAKP